MGSAPFAYKHIKPKLLSNAKLKGYILQALTSTNQNFKDDIRAITATWHHPPTVLPYIRYRGGDIYNGVEIYDTHGRPVDVFQMLDQGVWNRYAVMTRDFQPKTRKGYIGSVAGQGHLAKVMKTPVNKHPGIVARQWTLAIREKEQPVLYRVVREAIKKGTQP